MKPKKENKKGGAIVSLIVGIIFVLLAIMCFIGGHGLSAWRQSKRFE